MFLLGVEVVLGSYISVRVYEKLTGKKHTKDESADSKSKDVVVADSSIAEDKVEKNKDLHYMKASGASMATAGLAIVNPIFTPIALLGLAYSSVPYLRTIEHSLLKKKKVDGYVLYGVADLMTLGLGHIATASFAVGLVHTAHFIINNAEEDSKKSLANVFSKQPSKVWLLKEGVEIETELEDVGTGDIVVVHTGNVIPVDGVIVQGIASIDQHALTGESQPAEKQEGDTVFASTQVMSGNIQIQVTQSGNETTVAKITDILQHSVDFKTSSQLKGEQWADSWNLPVLGLAFAAMPVLGPIATVVILNGHIAQNIRVVAPLSTLNHLRIAASHNILVKDGRVLEDLSSIDTFLFDKTGTLTTEEPEVGKIHAYLDGYSEHDILAYAAAAEQKLQHPIARAIINRAEQENLVLPEIEDADYNIGHGVTVKIDSKTVLVGSHRFMEKEQVVLPSDLDDIMSDAYAQGHSLIMLAIDGKFAGILEMQASVRPEVVELLANLRAAGAQHLAIVSGDHKQPTQKLAEKLGMDDYYHDVMPQDKADIVEMLQKEGRKVCFIGDGVNDTIAMKKANISVSLSGATSVAMDTAQVILMGGSLENLNDLLKLSQDLNKNLKNAWLFNIVPGTVTVASAFVMLHPSILLAILMSQGGLGAGVVNAMLPLSKNKKEQVKLLAKESSE